MRSASPHSTGRLTIHSRTGALISHALLSNGSHPRVASNGRIDDGSNGAHFRGKYMKYMRSIPAKCCAALTTLVIAPASLAQAPSVAPQPNTIDGAVGRVYKSVGRDELRLHIFNPDSPPGSTQRSAIVLFFGGG